MRAARCLSTMMEEARDLHARAGRAPGRVSDMFTPEAPGVVPGDGRATIGRVLELAASVSRLERWWVFREGRDREE